MAGVRFDKNVDSTDSLKNKILSSMEKIDTLNKLFLKIIILTYIECNGKITTTKPRVARSVV
jgi:hypothetical protein